jgi:hypothetical protein
MIKPLITSLFSLVLTAGALNAQLLLNEIVVNPPGADDGKEFIELKGSPGSTLNNIFVVVIEGDPGSAGNSDLVIPLNGITLGSNGLVFIGTSLGYPNIAPPTVFKDTLIFGLPILDNGSISFLVLFSPSPILTNVDYDNNNDGVLELPQGAIIQDAVGWTNGDVDALIYGGVILSQSAGTPDAAVRFFDNTTPSSASAWYNGDLISPNQFDPLELSANFPQGAGITPGGINVPNNGVGVSQAERSSVGLFPNPASDWVQLDGIDAQQASAQLFDMSGKMQQLAISPEGRINVSGLPAGLYMLMVQDKTELRKANLMVIH